MKKAIGFVFILISLLLLIKLFDQQRDYFSINHNLFNQDFKPKPMGTSICDESEKKSSRGQICKSTFVPKTDEDISNEIFYGRRDI